MLVPDAPLVIKDAGENRMLSQDNLCLLAAHCGSDEHGLQREPAPVSIQAPCRLLCHFVILCFNILKCRREVNLICLTKLRGLNELIFC